MKSRLLVFTMLMAMIILIAGCGKKPPEPVVTVEPTLGSVPIVITTAEEFQSNITRWTGHLEDMASKVVTQFDRWEAKEIDLDGFIKAMEPINNTMQQLKRESDLRTEYEMNETPEEKEYYDQVRFNYDAAKKTLNDFLVMSQELTPELAANLKDFYTKNILGKFPEEVSTLKASLKKE